MTDRAVIAELARLLHQTSPDCRLQPILDRERPIHQTADLNWATALDAYGVGLRDELADAALAVIAARAAYRDALNGLGHPNEPHDRVLFRESVEVFDTVGDCSACGGAQYGTEDALEVAFDALHDALGVPRPEYRLAKGATG